MASNFIFTNDNTNYTLEITSMTNPSGLNSDLTGFTDGDQVTVSWVGGSPTPNTGANGDYSYPPSFTLVAETDTNGLKRLNIYPLTLINPAPNMGTSNTQIIIYSTENFPDGKSGQIVLMINGSWKNLDWTLNNLPDTSGNASGDPFITPLIQ
jgi:hypothetical protein